MYNGDGDNDGTNQERIDRCAAACFNKQDALAKGPWSSRGDAVGFGIIEDGSDSSVHKLKGRCFCQHETFVSCKEKHPSEYVAYDFVASVGSGSATSDAFPCLSAPQHTIPI